jgi:hypothetical protein
MEKQEKGMDWGTHLALGYPAPKKTKNHPLNGTCRNPRIIDKAGSRESLKLLIPNPCASPKTSLPIKYHLWFRVYEHHSRYPKPHFEYSKVIRIADSLRGKKFAQRLMKFFNRESNVGCKPLFHNPGLKAASFGCGKEQISNDYRRIKLMKPKNKSKKESRESMGQVITYYKNLKNLLSSKTMRALVLACEKLARYSIEAQISYRPSMSKCSAVEPRLFFYENKDDRGRQRLKEIRNMILSFNRDLNQPIETSEIESLSSSVRLSVTFLESASVTAEQNAEKEFLRSLAFVLTVCEKSHRLKLIREIQPQPPCCQVCHAGMDEKNYVWIVCEHFLNRTAKDVGAMLGGTFLCSDCAKTALDALRPELFGNMCHTCLIELLFPGGGNASPVEVPIPEKSGATLAQVEDLRN